MAASNDSETVARVRVRVQPRASRNNIVVETDGRIRLAVTAPPVDSAANKAVCAFVASVLGIPKRHVTVDQGAKSRDKTLRLVGMNEQEALARLQQADTRNKRG